jgi:monovalent cation:H+ antiporter-2, CPA2 family
MAEPLASSTLFSDGLVILGAAGIVIPLFARFRVTPIIGFILIGFLVGPYGLGQLVPQFPWLYHVTITEPEALEPFAEFGIIMVLFAIGLELSFNRLWEMRRQVFGLGALELLILGTGMGLAFAIMGQPVAGAFALGAALALSSTALVLPIAGVSSNVGKAALAMLLFEDIALVPIIFLLGAMSPGATGEMDSIVRTLWSGALVVAVLMVAGRFFLPRLFALAARTKSPEVFLSASLLVVIASALATSAVGLSPIVGALIAGLLIAETEYHGEVESITKPFKGLALGVFLLTVGMSIEPAAIWRDLGRIAAAVVLVIAFKAVVTAVLLRLMGARRSTATETGILMASPSETTLIVLAAATSAQLIAPDTARFWQVVTAIGLTVTPLLAWAGRRLGRRVEAGAPEPRVEEMAGRAVIVGFGRVGQLIADMLATHGKSYVAIDSDPDLVRTAQARGYTVTYGDVATSGMIERLRIAQAPAVILTMDEPVAMQRLVKRLHGQFPDLPIIARARDALHAAQLYRVGASDAVPETLESSLQLSEAVLVGLGVPMGPVIASIHEKRDELRAIIMSEGNLPEKPKLKSPALRERTL